MIILHLLAALALPASVAAVTLAHAASVLDAQGGAEGQRSGDLPVGDFA